MKVKLFTHDDLDGIGCGIIGSFAFPDIDITYNSYKSIDQNVKEFFESEEYKKYDQVYITDIRVTNEIASLINECEVNIKLIDHHSSSLDLKDNPWCIIKIDDENKIQYSGAYLFYEEVYGELRFRFTDFQLELIKKFVDIVRSYDTYAWKRNNDIIPKKFNDLFFFIGRDRFIANIVDKILIRNSIEFDNMDNMLFELEEEPRLKYIEMKMKHVKKVNIQNFHVGLVFAERYPSELGQAICTTFPEVDFAMIICLPGNVNLRTNRDDIYLNYFAELYGGGGHPKAAGFPILEEYVNVVTGLLTNHVDNLNKFLPYLTKVVGTTIQPIDIKHYMEKRKIEDDMKILGLSTMSVEVTKDS
jgi:oligoribonuclease NrnB/cAMP/cGMP phosphodiesterase (DHH superfamily)